MQLRRKHGEGNAIAAKRSEANMMQLLQKHTEEKMMQLLQKHTEANIMQLLQITQRQI